MKTKKNLKGFTLVELVIVATIMVMIMGSAMNFIQPLNNFYKRTQNLADSNDVGSILMDSVDNNMRFATNMVILEDYEGVPFIDDGYLCDSTGTHVSPQMTDVIIIDNESLRGSIYDYDENTPPAHAKGATGCIMKAPLLGAGTSDGIDFNHIDIIGQEAIYSDFKAEFNASLNGSDDKNKCVSIDMTLWRPELNRSTMTYEFNKKVYEQTRDLELVNINISNAAARGMSVSFFTDRLDDEGNPTGTAIDYNQYPNAAENGTETTDGQHNMYSSGIKRTFIFYSKATVVSSTDSTVKVGLIDKDTHEFICAPQEVNAGDVINDLLDQFKTLANDPSRVGIIYDGGNRYNVTLHSIKAPNGQTLDSYYDKAITETFNFEVKYISILCNDPVGSYEFWETYDASGNDIGSQIAADGTAFGDIFPDELGGADGYVSAPGTANRGTNGSGVDVMPAANPGERWWEGETVFYNPDLKYSGDRVWTCRYEEVPKAKFEFKDEGGSSLGGPDELDACYPEYERCTDPDDPDYVNGYKPTGVMIGSISVGDVSSHALSNGYQPADTDSKHFDYWEVVDTTTSTNLGKLNDITVPFEKDHEYECTAVMAENSVAPTDIFTVTDTQVEPNQYWRDTYKIEVTNSSADNLKSVTFMVTFDAPVKSSELTKSVWLNYAGMRFGTGGAESICTVDPDDPKRVQVVISGGNDDWSPYVMAAGNGENSTVRFMIQVAPATAGTTLNVENVETVSTTPR